MLEIRNVSLSLGRREILRGASLTLPAGTLTALVGRNGCGKSTLLSCAAGLCRHGGTVLLRGEELHSMTPRERAKRLALLPQTLSAPHVTVEELAGLGRNPYVDLGQRFTEKDREAVSRAMERAGVAELRGRFLDELSGGERQRAYLAMILAQETELLLLDEPTTHMDMGGGDAFMRCLQGLQAEGRTLLAVMHDLSQAVRYADRVAVMDGGRIVFGGSVERCLAEGALQRHLAVRRYEAEGRSFFASED